MRALRLGHRELVRHADVRSRGGVPLQVQAAVPVRHTGPVGPVVGVRRAHRSGLGRADHEGPAVAAIVTPRLLHPVTVAVPRERVLDPGVSPVGRDHVLVVQRQLQGVGRVRRGREVGGRVDDVVHAVQARPVPPVLVVPGRHGGAVLGDLAVEGGHQERGVVAAAVLVDPVDRDLRRGRVDGRVGVVAVAADAHVPAGGRVAHHDDVIVAVAVPVQILVPGDHRVGAGVRGVRRGVGSGLGAGVDARVEARVSGGVTPRVHDPRLAGRVEASVGGVGTAVRVARVHRGVAGVTRVAAVDAGVPRVGIPRLAGLGGVTPRVGVVGVRVGRAAGVVPAAGVVADAVVPVAAVAGGFRGEAGDEEREKAAADVLDHFRESSEVSES